MKSYSLVVSKHEADWLQLHNLLSQPPQVCKIVGGRKLQANSKENFESWISEQQ